MSRRGNNEGSIYKDKQGRWRGLVSMPSANGQYKRKYIYGKTRKEVSDKMNELLRQLRSNTYVEPCKTTLYEFLHMWLNTYAKNVVRQTTFTSYETYIEKHIKGSIGNFPLCDLNTIIIQNWYNEKVKNGKLDGSGGLSPKTIRNLHNMLHKALKQAVFLDQIPKNPTDFVVIPRQAKKEMRYFSVEEQRQLQEIIKGNRLEMPILVSLYTGVRQGELLGLPWRNVHLIPNGQSYIRVSQALLRVKNTDSNSNNKTVLVITEPKTPHSIRNIPLLPEVANRLAEYKNKQAQYNRKHNLLPSELVFTSAAGTPIEPRNMQRDFKLLLRKHGMRVINIHGLRHTFATRSLESGMSIKTLSQILGHSNVAFTMDVYCHSSDELKFTEMELLNGFL